MFAIVAAACAGPATEGDVEKEAAPEGDAARGKELYESPLGCNVCHGMDAAGELGPNIRQTSIENVYHALQNFPDMMNWQFNNPDLFEEQSLLDIVAYLNTLEREPEEE